ncbi:MAG: S8 family serine peptidase [Pseudomonadota bacterium]
MIIIMAVQRALLGLLAAAALFSSFANAQTSTPKQLMLGTGGGGQNSVTPPEEMVAGFIVRPHRQNGKKLDAALQAYDARKLVSAANVPLRVWRPMSGNAHVLKLDAPVKLSEARAIAARMMNDGSVELAEPDRILYPTATPADPAYAGAPGQWHYMAPAGANKGGANLPAAWDLTLGNTAIKVAVLDTGIRQHADLGIVLTGHDFITNSSIANDGGARDSDASDPGDWATAGLCGAGEQASDSSWHGTHVAGTIAALMNNGIGGTGVAPNVKILPVRVLGRCGGTTSDIVDGMRWAAGLAVPGVPNNLNVANILNLSLGASGACSVTFQAAVTEVVNAGKIIVVATGNDGQPIIGQPANCTGVIAVTAHAIDGDNADYANVGPETTISASGGGCGNLTTSATCSAGATANGLAIYSLSNASLTTPGADSYAIRIGTSMAAPHVSGVVALMLSLDPSLTPAQVASTLRSSARPHPPGSSCLIAALSGKCGAGLLDAHAALTVVAPTVSVNNVSQIVAPDAFVTLSGSATAPGGATISSYSWTPFASNPAPAAALSGANTATATFTAPVTGIYSFTLTATDNLGRSNTANASVRINSAPVLPESPSQGVVAGNTLQFTLAATDPDGNAIIFSSASLPAGATLSGAGVFRWPDAAPAGSYTLTYFASDDISTSAAGTLDIVVMARSSGGGGSMGGESLIGLGMLAAYLRIRRATPPARVNFLNNR